MLTIDHMKLVGRQPREVKKFRRHLLGLQRGEVHEMTVQHEADNSCRREGSTELFGPSAFEIRMMAKGKFGGGPFKVNNKVNKEVIDAFLADMAAAGKACQRVPGVCPWPRPQAN
jgi:hypothetical protein